MERVALDPAETAERIGVSIGTLAAWRRRRIGPAFVRLGGRKVAYLIADIDAWLMAQREPAGAPLAPRSTGKESPWAA